MMITANPWIAFEVRSTHSPINIPAPRAAIKRRFAKYREQLSHLPVNFFGSLRKVR